MNQYRAVLKYLMEHLNYRVHVIVIQTTYNLQINMEMNMFYSSQYEFFNKHLYVTTIILYIVYNVFFNYLLIIFFIPIKLELMYFRLKK